MKFQIRYDDKFQEVELSVEEACGWVNVVPASDLSEEEICQLIQERISGMAPDVYSVLTPLSDRFEVYGDNLPLIDVNEVRVSLFTKGNYLETKRQITQALLAADFTITDRLFVGFEKDTKYYQVAIDVAKHYEMEG